jgi:hypothetical protein
MRITTHEDVHEGMHLFVSVLHEIASWIGSSPTLAWSRDRMTASPPPVPQGDTAATALHSSVCHIEFGEHSKLNLTAERPRA